MSASSKILLNAPNGSLFEKAKAVTRAFYGTGPRFSYWTGCSTGGRQGWIMAQRHPEEYDGLLTGAPAFNWDRFIPAELWGQVVMKDEVGAPIAPAKLNAVTNAAVAACAGIPAMALAPVMRFSPIRAYARTNPPR